MKMTHTELGLRERRAIEDMLNARMSVDKIAAEIGRHRSTVFREIKRNRFVDDELPNLNGYSGMTAQSSAANRRARRRKLVRFEDLRKHVIQQLEIGWSPEQIAGSLQYDGQTMRVSHEAIYAYVYSPDGQSEELARYLPHRRKKNASLDVDAHRVALFSRLIGQSMSGPTTSKPVRHSVNGKVI